jgi:hypothetical protein
MTCSVCSKEIIEGVHTGEHDEIVTCWACVAKAARRSRMLGYLDQIHEALGHAGTLEDCPTCEPAAILHPLR